jgi:redox-sensitive bicupin YhaK (pirin superfamily)
MSENLPDHEPHCAGCAAPSVELLIQGRPRDLGGFTVRRLLPSPQRRLVGPFIFLDQMGPAEILPGAGFDVRPHPHIALATLTYLFDGAIMHRDSVGSVQVIHPGDVNWMVAGRGIVHSERATPELRASGFRIYGLQCWLALPLAEEETEPSFTHHPQATIPRLEREGVKLDVIAGNAFGERSPVEVLSPTLYVQARMDAGATLQIDAEHAERALFVVEGAIEIEGQKFEAGDMLVLREGATPSVRALEATRMMLLGGAKLEGERFMFWNFVSSSKERIERAKLDWKEERFERVPGEVERIPLPE